MAALHEHNPAILDNDGAYANEGCFWIFAGQVALSSPSSSFSRDLSR
jgi:hypothetical protein